MIHEHFSEKAKYLLLSSTILMGGCASTAPKDKVFEITPQCVENGIKDAKPYKKINSDCAKYNIDLANTKIRATTETGKENIRNIAIETYLEALRTWLKHEWNNSDQEHDMLVKISGTLEHQDPEIRNAAIKGIEELGIDKQQIIDHMATTGGKEIIKRISKNIKKSLPVNENDIRILKDIYDGKTYKDADNNTVKQYIDIELKKVGWNINRLSNLLKDDCIPTFDNDVMTCN